MMGVSESLIKQNEKNFEHMVEFIGYRIYYNLNSWYKMLTFFPGYRFSAEFMEKMMGVETHLPVIEERYSFFKKFFFYFPQTLIQTIKISFSFLFLGKSIKKFNKDFDKVFFNANSIDLKELSLPELKNAYLELDRSLLSRWRIPIANDFAVMVSAGLADKLFRTWLNSKDAYLYMQTGLKAPLISLDPGEKIKQIVGLIRKDAEIYNIFLNTENDKEILYLLESCYSANETSREIFEYLKKFGTRMPNELKLETETLFEKPENFIVLIKTSLRGTQDVKASVESAPFGESYKELNWAKKVFLKRLLNWAGNSIQRREEARFRRTLVFGQVRKIFIAIGRKLADNKPIELERDIFFLKIEEIFSLIDGLKTNLNIPALIKQRKQEFFKWQNLVISRRFETDKNVNELEQELLSQPSCTQKGFSGQIAGIIASRPQGRSVFFGTALTLKTFDSSASFEGKILVTCQTDPGWTVVFPLLKGVVVERGGKLSHAAIVARELNIPCIVGAEGATDLIPDGAKIRLDMESGQIFVK